MCPGACFHSVTAYFIVVLFHNYHVATTVKSMQWHVSAYINTSYTVNGMNLLYFDRPLCSQAQRFHLVSTEKKGKMSLLMPVVTDFWSRSVSLHRSHLSVELLSQSHVSRFGFHPKIYFGALFKSQTISHRVALWVCAIQHVDLWTCVGTNDKETQ